MSLENFGQKNNFSETEQKKFEKYFNFVKNLFDSFSDSDSAYETALKIDECRDRILNKNLNPHNFYLWSLISPEASKDEKDYAEFDTPEGDIENLFKELKKQEIEREKSLAA